MQRYDSYKDSGVQWLGEIPSHWEVKRLASYFTERRVKVSDKEFEPLSVTKNGILPQLDDVAKSNDSDNRKLVLAGDFVINSRSDRKGSSGVSSLNGSVSLINLVLQPRTGIYPNFCNYLLKCNSFVEEYYRNGRGIVADLWTTRFDEMKTIKMAIPPLPEQEAMVSYLDKATAEIDEAISQQQKMIDLLNERKQIIINNAITKGLNPNAKMKDSGVEWIGEIPEHWEVVPIKRFLDVRDGTHDTPEYISKSEFAYPLVTSKDFVDGEICFDEVKWISSNAYFEIAKRSYVDRFDVITSMIGGNIGKSVIKMDDRPIAIKNVALFKTKGDLVVAKYLYYYMLGGFITSQVELNSRGGAQSFLGLTDMRNLIYFNLPYDERRQIVEFLDKQITFIDNSILSYKKQIELLQERKQILINEVVTGKVKVG